MMNRTRLFLATLLLMFSAASILPQRAAADEDDPPSRVARLSFTRGEVSFGPAGTDDWVSAVLNRPITTGDKLWTGDDARAELHLGSMAVRLGQQTGFSFLNLSDRMTQIRLTEGTLNLRVRRINEDESIEIDTPNLAFSVLRPGRYTIRVNEDGNETVVLVRDGQGEVTGGGAAFNLRAGDEGVFRGTDTLDSNLQSIDEEDDFEIWCTDRDRREDRAVARRYVSDDVIGYEDLDDYGGWRPVPEYGTVWFPHVTVVNWAPYRFGHWAWVSPWGWTWVDDAPWGFAPFHYGRWVFVGGAWGWVPCPPRPVVVGVAYVRPVYAPALVAWVGGPHFAAGVAFGGGFAVGVNVGWFPLGPREVFVPSYPVSRTYINNVNVSNTTVNQTVINNYYNTTVVNNHNVNVNNNVTNVKYVNQSVPGAVTATSGQNFSTAQPVARNMVAVNQNQVASAPVVAAAPAVAPPKQAVLGSGAATSVHPPAALQNRAVVAKAAPPPPPAPFQKQQAAIQANQGRPVAMSEIRIAPTAAQVHNNAAVKIAPPAKPMTMPVNSNSNTNPNRPPTNPTPAATTQPAKPTNTRGFEDRPPASRPTSQPSTPSNPQLDQKHQQQAEQLQQKQDQERQKLDQKQFEEKQKLDRQAAEQQKQRDAEQKQLQAEQKQRELDQKHQQQLQQMEQKHQQEQQKLQQKQQQERQQPPPPKEPKKEAPKPKEEKHH